MIDQESKLKVIMNYKGRKSVMVTACHSSMPHSTTATILKNKTKVMEIVKRSAHWN